MTAHSPNAVCDASCNLSYNTTRRLVCKRCDYKLGALARHKLIQKAAVGHRDCKAAATRSVAR